jgi:2Fe-2S ferredoxin
MASLEIVGRDGSIREVEGQIGWSVMEIIREAGIDEVLALCGGCCSCATCHVHVDEGWIDLLPPPSSDEQDLLETSSHCAPTSRLSCQIKFSQELDGLRVSIAPED